MDPLEQQQPPSVAPAPASPAEVPGIPSMPGGTGMSQEDMKANLQALMEKIQGKYQDFNTAKFSSDNKMKELEGQSLRAFFDMLQSMGIDPSNMDEVKALLDKIKASNPDLYNQIEQSLQSLLGDNTEDNGSIPQNIEEGGGAPQNMNIQNEDIQQSL